MRFIFLFFCCCYAYQITHHKEHLRKIHNVIYDYSNVYNVNSICNTIEKRLYSSGIYPNTPDFCVNATIKSQFADSLHDLYSLFKWSNPDFIIQIKRALAQQRQQCEEPCNKKNYLGTTDTKIFVHNIIPEMKWHPCFDTPDYINITNSKHVGKNRKYLWSGEFVCQPLKPIVFGPIQTTFEKYNQICFGCINNYTKGMLEFESHRQFIGPTMKTRLRLEIARVWRKQMPEIIANNTVMSEFDIR